MFVKIELKMTVDEYFAFKTDCNINQSQRISVNGTDLTPIYEQLYNQLSDTLDKVACGEMGND